MEESEGRAMETGGNPPKEVALFMENLPENPLEDPNLQSHPDFLALKSLAEETPEETAEWLKEQGNLALKKGKKYYKSALDYYSRAIAEKGNNKNNNSIYYSNKSHVEFLCRNFRNSLEDAKTAIQLNPSNVKAYFRAAKSAFTMGKLDVAKDHCVKGMNLDPDNPEFVKLKSSIDEKFEEEFAKSNEIKSVLKRAENLADAILSRKISMGSHSYKDLTSGKRPWLDESGVLHWPILFLYGESMSTDFIEDCSENDRLSDHLDIMFGEGSTPLEWDTEHHYKRNTIEIYYRKFGTPALTRKELISSILENDVGSTMLKQIQDTLLHDEEENRERSIVFEESKYVKLNTKSVLKSILSQSGHIIPGIPVFYIVSNQTKFREIFLSGEWSLP